MNIRELIKDKGFEVIAVDAGTSVDQSIEKMLDRNIGALLVVEDGKAAGIFTERDVLKCWVKNRDFENVKLGDVMTREMVVTELDDDVSQAMSTMIQKKVRHLPVVDKSGQIVSILSIRDVVKGKVSKLMSEVHYLKDYLSGGYPG